MIQGNTGSISGISIEDFHQRVADHGTFLGGGSVAAVTGAGAASLVQLVLGLAARRKVNAEHRASIEAGLSEATELHRRFNEAADADALALDTLLASQKAIKASGNRGAYQAALLGAAQAPLEAASDCLALLRIIQQNMRFATTFTVSDLGAASALAFGALQAATMMCEVNLTLLRSEDGTDQQVVLDLEAKSADLVRQGAQVAEDVGHFTRSAIRKNG